MRILFIADGRSPIARGWIQYFIGRKDEVFLATSFPGETGLKTAATTFVPLAFSRAKQPAFPEGGAREERMPEQRQGVWAAPAVGLRMALRHWLGTLTLPAAGRQLANLILDVRPDLIHALRIPFEGMAAAEAVTILRRAGKPVAPLVVSVWGNDFTLHAAANWMMARHTRRTLQEAMALHTDCQRDARLARQWGFPLQRPILVVPTSGGINLDVFSPPPSEDGRTPNLVIQPRGVRAYVRNDTFFAAVGLVRAARPSVRFICPAMSDDPTMQALVDRLGVADVVALLPRTAHHAMADLFRQAQVVVSLTEHDGTPNTLLEAMACGCLPIVGDIETMHEWITDGQNGLIVPPGNAQALAHALLRALDDPAWRSEAARRNVELVTRRAEYGQSMAQVQRLYATLVGS
jgi:glycosyltransferase involved in cell wall biosynthesis